MCSFPSLDAFVEKIVSPGHRDGGFSLSNGWRFSWLMAGKKGTSLGNILYLQNYQGGPLLSSKLE